MEGYGKYFFLNFALCIFQCMGFKRIGDFSQIKCLFIQTAFVLYALAVKQLVVFYEVFSSLYGFISYWFIILIALF